MVSVAIITKNEEKNISKCLESLLWADEIIVVDSGSTDKTIDICKKYKCKIIQTDWKGFGKNKQYAVKHTSNDWVLSLDADEIVSPSLAKAIIKTVKLNEKLGYRIKRNSFYLGKLIKFSGWQNDYPLRLFNKKYGNFNDFSVHESVIMPEEVVAKINSPIIHFPYNKIEDHLNKINNYSSLAAENLLTKDKTIFYPYAFIAGAFKFLRVYFLKLGFLDGKEGLILAILSAYYVFLKYIKLWLMKNKK